MKKVHNGFTLIELMIVVAITGILSAVAIPSWIKYVRRSRTIEATMNVRKMFDGAAAYFLAEHGAKDGGILNKMFSRSAGPTPAFVPKGERAQPVLSTWKTPEWAAIDFMITDPHYYQYTFNNLKEGGVGVEAEAEVIAIGDLDGDGFYSKFMRKASGTLEGVQGWSALYTENETE